jgi:murein DD-endopeptidase MepM/ murein hydrolase activator NlpD
VKGQQIALSGNTPSVTPHLDYRVFYDGVAIDPLGSKVAPYYMDKNGNFHRWPAQSKVFLSEQYKIKRGLTSKRLKGKTEEQLIRDFPCCLGYSN